ncbi:hypothetical protein H2200_008022 [Cladophialophora chaetospira]|uniref:ABC transporter n=1 Tax=Cladophialophora chaetospira TaxID=386627 RepID=A0AA38X7D2_9EURO|nr:hypothetical protein H2200_008022 [Cladophialophora chaetospira]
MTRGALVTAIYAKTTQQSATTIDESAALTLMSADVQNICDALTKIQEVWASMVEIGLGIWLLTREIGLALLAPIVVTVVSVFATMFVSRKMASAMKTWMGAVQSRIDTTSTMLESMIGVKMLGLTPTLKAFVSGLRKNEINKSLRSRKLLATCICLANAPSALAPGFAFVFYVLKTRHGDGTLDVSRAFTALSLISLVTTPVSALIFAVPPLMESFGCLERIQSFLCSPARQDHRLITESSGKVTDTKLGHQSQDITLQTLKSKRAESPLRLIHTTFAWTAQQESVVKDVSFELAPGSLTLLVGPVGCGKSTLLRGLLGEIPISQGFVYVESPHTALVQQSPWIQHKSLRHNVLGTSMFDKKWYETVIHACALKEDITTLPEGDLTIVGSAGHGLSGGQRLRLALARAVYSRSQLLILDDTFSGLDPETEEAIFTRLLGRRGLLRQLGITVLLVTHAAHRFSFADYIVALTPQGTVAEEGTFPELMSNRGYVASVVARRKIESDANEELPAHPEETKDAKMADPATEGAIRPLGDIQVYKYYFSASGWRNTAVFFIAILFFAFFSRFPDLWMKFWTSAVAEYDNSVNATYVGVFLTLGVVALLCVVVVAFYVFIFMVPEAAWNFHEDLLNTVMSAPSHFFTTTPTGQTLNRFSQDLNLVDMELPTALIQVSGPFCLGVVQAIFICLSAAYFVTALPPVFVVLYFLQKYYLRTARQIRLLEIESKAPLYSHFLETLSGLVTIRAFGWTKAFEELNIDLLDKSQKPFYLLFCIQRWLALVLDLIVAALAVILMVMVVKLREQLDSDFVALALLNVMSFNTNLTAVIQMWTALESSLGAVARLKNVKEGTRSENLVGECESVQEDWPANGRIDITNLSARYAEDLPDVVQNITLSIAAGEKVAICGTSGSGKSSLVACLFRMLEISSGSVIIDGKDISQLPRQIVRQRLNAIPQSSFFFKGSIRRNLDPWNSANNDQAEAALRKVGLWDIVSSTPLGLDSQLKDVEELLSHGQRQLFCLARATLRASKVVVMDEVSSSVDLETDKVMQRIIREDFASCTVIAVAHRLETIVDFDRVVVMQSGRIIEVGKPQALLEEAGSAFRRLWGA